MAMESEHGNGVDKHSQTPAEVKFDDDDAIFGLRKSSSSAVESGHSGASNNELQPPAAVVTVIEDDLPGLGKISSSSAVESGYSGVTIIEDDLLGLGKTSSTVMKSGDDGTSNKHTQTSADVTLIDDDLLETGEMSDPSSPSSSSSSSSSDSSFDENFFLIDEIEPDQDPQPDVETNNLLQLDEDPRLPLSYSAQGSHSKPASPGPTHAPDVSAPGSDSSSPSISPKQSPKIQLMESLEPPDPNRIPATVFARTKSTAPVEWSTASNESLFSIHMGNNSFSRDQIFLMGRSQELGKSDDMFKFPNNTSSEVNNFSTPARSATISDQKSSGICVAEVAAETMKEVIRETAQDRNKAKPSAEVMHRSISISHRSQDSNASTMSFAFPILTKDGTKASPVKVELEKQKSEQQKQQQQSPPQTPGGNSTGTNWFSCFTCSFCR
ncbi:Glutamate--trna ligase [Thalictrum thalictroides]|uniref:Glutamate--trna ligase n=1 Tax=Thalictrum thalictroides TaxID=46969 RepID=A0A7J6V7B2_THATH|nr:Glutamate--trna ligase [Thalictrum thalictroides]